MGLGTRSFKPTLRSTVIHPGKFTWNLQKRDQTGRRCDDSIFLYNPDVLFSVSSVIPARSPRVQGLHGAGALRRVAAPVAPCGAAHRTVGPSWNQSNDSDRNSDPSSWDQYMHLENCGLFSCTFLKCFMMFYVCFMGSANDSASRSAAQPMSLCFCFLCLPKNR